MTYNKALHQVIVQSLIINPTRFLRYFGPKPNDQQFEIAVKAVRELIEDFAVSELKLECMEDYSLLLRHEPTAKVLFCLTFADFYLETSTGSNRKVLNPETASKREAMADNILTYLSTQMDRYVDHNKLYAWALDKHSPPSARPKRHVSDPSMKSTVQPAQPISSTPPAP